MLLWGAGGISHYLWLENSVDGKRVCESSGWQNQATCISHHFANKSEASSDVPRTATGLDEKPKVQINNKKVTFLISQLRL